MIYYGNFTHSEKFCYPKFRNCVLQNAPLPDTSVHKQWNRALLSGSFSLIKNRIKKASIYVIASPLFPLLFVLRPWSLSFIMPSYCMLKNLYPHVCYIFKSFYGVRQNLFVSFHHLLQVSWWSWKPQEIKLTVFKVQL